MRSPISQDLITLFHLLEFSTGVLLVLDRLWMLRGVSIRTRCCRTEKTGEANASGSVTDSEVRPGPRSSGRLARPAAGPRSHFSSRTAQIRQDRCTHSRSGLRSVVLLGVSVTRPRSWEFDGGCDTLGLAGESQMSESVGATWSRRFLPEHW